MKLDLVFFGRLETEKGFHLIIELLKSNSDNFFIHIFGDGTLKDDLVKIKFNNYKYYGRQNISYINSVLQKSDFVLMPSFFLETFGLVALESIKQGIPVIGFKKGGLNSFILDELDISRQEGNDDGSKLNNLLYKIQNNYSLEKKQYYNQLSLKIAMDYSINNWLNNFRNLIPQKSRKILIVSDYLDNLGGIENHIYHVKDVLEVNQFEVKLFGYKSKVGKIGKAGRILSFLIAPLNIIYYFKINKVIKEYNPDIIRCHSVLRFLGWLVIYGINQSKATKIMFYHDFGYFHPFPSKVYSEEQLLSFNFSNYLKMSNVGFFTTIFAVVPKYFITKILISQLKKFHFHLVPSAFMTKYLSQHFTEDKIKTLSHFIQD